MKPISKDEAQKARLIQMKTGKKLRTCVYCLRYQRGNFQKALELCSGDAEEGGRRSL